MYLKSVCCTPWTYTAPYVNCNSIKLEEENKVYLGGTTPLILPWGGLHIFEFHVYFLNVLERLVLNGYHMSEGWKSTGPSISSWARRSWPGGNRFERGFKHTDEKGLGAHVASTASYSRRKDRAVRASHSGSSWYIDTAGSESGRPRHNGQEFS